MAETDVCVSRCIKLHCGENVPVKTMSDLRGGVSVSIVLKLKKKKKNRKTGITPFKTLKR